MEFTHFLPLSCFLLYFFVIFFGIFLYACISQHKHAKESYSQHITKFTHQIPQSALLSDRFLIILVHALVNKRAEPSEQLHIESHILDNAVSVRDSIFPS
jgi:hypothetical protein